MRKKHITHAKNIIILKDYAHYVKDLVKSITGESNKKIINDEAYKFPKY